MADETTEVLMPLMGEGITEATLVKWLKKPGEAVKKDEPLLEVSTDKVDTEIPSPAAGFLVETFAADGDMVAVNKVIALVAADPSLARAGGTKAEKQPAQKLVVKPATGGGDVAGEALRGSLPPEAPELAKVSSSQIPLRAFDTESISLPRRQKSSPLVRKMARDLKIDLRTVTGSGLGGRITKRDLETLENRTTSAAPLKSHTQQSAHLEWGRLETKRDGNIEVLDGVPVRREKMSRMRSLIAEHMVRSVRTSPHVTTVFEIDLHSVVRFRERTKNAFQAREGFNLTYTPFFVDAAVQAIKRIPIVNVSVDGDDILWKDQINVGVAVAIETGLIVPVIRDAGDLNLLGIARRLNDLATRARSKKLKPEDVQGGTFSITNPGMFGSLVSAPIINQPQVAILSIGAIIKRPVVVNDMIAIRPLVQVGLTFDHRVVDGEGGARYLAALKEALEGFDEGTTL